MTKLKLTNLVDLAKAREGLIPPEQIRSVEVEALVDTGATTLALPADVVAALGLHEIRKVTLGLGDGRIQTVSLVGDLRIEILGRDMTCDALVMPEGTTPLIGQIPLEELDLVVHPKSRDLMVNPAHPEGRLYVLRVA